MTKEKEFKISDTLPEGVESMDDVPDCSTEICQEAQADINRICQRKGWPAGTPIIIYFSDGKVCKCFCK